MNSRTVIRTLARLLTAAGLALGLSLASAYALAIDADGEIVNAYVCSALSPTGYDSQHITFAAGRVQAFKDAFDDPEYEELAEQLVEVRAQMEDAFAAQQDALSPEAYNAAMVRYQQLQARALALVTQQAETDKVRFIDRLAVALRDAVNSTLADIAGGPGLEPTPCQARTYFAENC